MSAPATPDERARLGASVPPAVLEVCRALAGAGHEAVCVGGAVRDALLGRAPGDWDVATSARPEVVQRVFPRTIPTGVQHGTVTVLIGKGAERRQVEVTTYRGEGAYSDARRPDAVRFGVPLEEDLARRDFVVNAMAFDPVGGALIDPFGGRADLAARTLRAVGDPLARFTEDGLRVMRAVRFVAELDFELEEATAAALGGALGSLAKVARERVRTELGKLLVAPAAARGLELMATHGILAAVLPEATAAGLARARRAGGTVRVAMAALLLDGGAQAAADALRRLTFSNDDRAAVVALVRAARGLARDAAAPARRRALAEAGRAAAPALAALLRADGRDGDAAGIEAIAAAGDPLGPGDLAIKGGELMGELGLEPGPTVGELTRYLVERVLEDPGENTRARLLELARAKAAAG
jgi:tRNA nucleotidyltransferase (CCA-adding enzyme)